MTDEQQRYFKEQLLIHERAKVPVNLLHGDCVGVDARCHEIATKAGATTELFPSNSTKHRAFKRGTVTHDGHPPLVRNKLIVKGSDRVIGFPGGPEILRSGTWSTIRFAKKIGKPITVVMPDGSYEHFNIVSIPE